MFERYTEQARRALFFARYEASQLGSVTIETDHLLLGLIHEGKGIADKLLARARVPLETIRTTLRDRAKSKAKSSTSVEIPFTEETKRVLLQAGEEADRLLHNYIGTEHLLLGILREEGSAAAAILTQHGLRLNAVRDDLVQLLHDRSAPDFQGDFASVGTDALVSDSSSFFEVRIAPATGAGISTSRPGSWVAECDLRTLLSRVCDCPMARVELPSRLDKDERHCFSVRYAPEQPEPMRNRLMLAWIEVHFHIAVTREARLMDVYVLTAPDGLSPSVKEAQGEDGGIGTFGSMFYLERTGDETPRPESLDAFLRDKPAAIVNVAASNATLAEFGQLLEPGLDRFVVDETGLTGRYDLQVTGEAASTDEFRQRLRDQLGLVLTPASREVTMLVVRDAEAT